jgi:prevent-host-death family protein
LTRYLVNRMLRGLGAFNIHEAKTQLAQLIRRVRAGQEAIITDAGTPVAKLVPIEQPKTARVLGSDRGKIWVAPDAFEPLAGEDLAVWIARDDAEIVRGLIRGDRARRRSLAQRSSRNYYASATRAGSEQYESLWQNATLRSDAIPARAWVAKLATPWILDTMAACPTIPPIHLPSAPIGAHGTGSCWWRSSFRC